MKSYVVPLFLVLAVVLVQCEAGLLLQNLGHAAKTVGEGIKNGTMKAEEKIKEILHVGTKKESMVEATTILTPPVESGDPPVVLSKTRTSIGSIPRCAPGETFSDGACRSSSIAELE